MKNLQTNFYLKGGILRDWKNRIVSFKVWPVLTYDNLSPRWNKIFIILEIWISHPNYLEKSWRYWDWWRVRFPWASAANAPNNKGWENMANLCHLILFSQMTASEYSTAVGSFQVTLDDFFVSFRVFPGFNLASVSF